MKVLIDGKEVKCENDVCVIYEDQVLELRKKNKGKDVWGQVHVKLNSEGLIVDTVKNNCKEFFKSFWAMVDDLVEMTH
jgi:hypothetical protein